MKKVKELALIEVAEQRGKELMIYNYHYIDGKLTMISEHQELPHKSTRIETLFYYLKNDILFFKVGNTDAIEDLSYHIQNARKLKASAPLN